MRIRVGILALIVLMAGGSCAYADRQSDLKTFGDYANTIHRQLASLTKIQLLDKARENDKAFRDAYRAGQFAPALKLVQANVAELDKAAKLVLQRASSFLEQAEQYRKNNQTAEANEALKQAGAGRDLASAIMLIRDEHRLLCGFTSKFMGDSKGAAGYFGGEFNPPGSQFGAEYKQMKAVATAQLAEIKH